MKSKEDKMDRVSIKREAGLYVVTDHRVGTSLPYATLPEAKARVKEIWK